MQAFNTLNNRTLQRNTSFRAEWIASPTNYQTDSQHLFTDRYGDLH
jgi:hypothetical protein